MSQKSHLVSGSIGIALGAVLTAMLIPSSMQKATTSLAQNTQPEVIKPIPLATTNSSLVPPSIEEKTNVEVSTQNSSAAATNIKALYALRATVEASDAIKLFFSSEENINLEQNKNLFISPNVEDVSIYPIWWGGVGMQLRGDFKPETTYTITLKAGTESSKGEKLLKDVSFTVTTPAQKPELSIMAWRGQMALTPETSIAYAFTACKEIEVKAWRAFNNNLITYGQSTWRDNLLEPCGSQTFKVPYDKVNEQHALLPIYELVNGKPGIYRFRLSTETCSDECYILLSNIGASYVYDHRLTPIVALQNLIDGTPIANARVSLYDYKNQCIATGTSDAQGFAITAPTPAVASRTSEIIPMRMIIIAGDDTTIIECENTTRHQAYLPNYNEMASFPTYLWPDRDALHPGENVQIYGLIRTATLKAAKDIPLSLELFSPEDTLLASTTTTSNQDGCLTTSFSIPKGAKSGYYTVVAKAGDETLNTCDLYVSDFTPNHVKLNATFIDNNIEALSLTTMTYFGSAVTKGSGYYQITAKEAPLPDAWKGWSVGTQEDFRQLHSDTFQKDSKDATFTLDGVDPDVLKTFDTPVRVEANISFSEPNARAVKTSTFVDKSYYPVYLGMRYDENTKMLEFKQLATEENTVNATSITEFFLTEHISTYELVKENNDWRYTWVNSKRDIPITSILPDEQSIPINEDIVRLPLEKLAPGHYTLSAMLGEVTTSITFWHDTSELGKQLGNPSNLVFKTDKPTYKAGDVAMLTFNAPVDGRLIITTGDTVLQRSVAMEVKKGTVNVPISIPTETTHGIWHAGFSLIAKDVSKDGRFFGLAPLTIDHSDKALKVALDLPKVVKPKETIPVKLNLSDKEGKPCRGTVALFAVDEAVLNVTAYETPNPHTILFQRKGQTFTFGDIYSTLLPQLKIGPDGRIGGGGKVSLEGSLMRDKIDLSKETTVLTLPLQTIDASGTVTLPVELPDFKGSLRFMAIVANEEKVGATDATLIVREPVTLTASGVRYGCEGDQAECTLRVINHDLPKQAYTLTMADQTFCGDLASGETAYHTLLLPVGETTATLKMGDFTSSITHKVTLQEEIPTHDVVAIHRLNDGGTLPEGAETLPTLEAAQNIALDWLANYPYRCTEQLSARMLPYASSTRDDERAFVKTLFNTLMPRMSTVGYFTLWDNGVNVHTMASLSASHVLIEGSNAGILPVDNLPKVLDFLNLVANNTETKLRGEAAYAAFLLGEAGAKQQAVHAARNLLIANDEDSAAFVAAATLVFNGFADEGAPKMKTFLKKNPRPQPLVNSYMDDATAQAMTLAFAMRAGVCTDEEAENRLSTLLTTPWTTTQANAWAACALATCEKLPNGTLYRTLVPSKTIPDNAPIHVVKRILSLDAEPITTMKHGDLAFMVITIDLPTNCNNLVIRDRLPGGLEYEDANLASREAIDLPKWAMEAIRFHPQAEENLGAELRFFGSASKGTTTVIYPVRATAKGTFAIPAAIVEDMYNVDCIGGDDPTETLIIQ